MKVKMKRLTALMLCIATVLSMFAQGFAATDTQADTAAPSALTAEQGSLKNVTDPATGRPRLYVDFLGDNAGHNLGGTNTPKIGSAVRVENRDFSLDTNGADFANGWDKYTQDATYWSDSNGDGAIGAGEDGTIFYVGVGIDRVNLLKMLGDAENEGVYSFEAGFYYNPQFVEPYVANGDYAETIKNTNLSGGTLTSSGQNARWDASNYRVLEAYTDLDPQMDGGLTSAGAWGELTQEVIANPTNAQISRAANGWKMTYVSVEMKADRIAEAARLAGYYDGKFHPTEDGDTTQNRETEYLLVIPFVLKAYDTKNDLCFRLIRNATHFTMGAAPDGAENRAAWERVTTRNAPNNLKLQTVFTGDLNIFTGKKAAELENRYKATLVMDGGGTRQNTAEVAINGDPATNYARITRDGEELLGLAGGTGMHIETHIAPRYSVTVKTYPAADATKTNLITFIEIPSSKDESYREFGFIMPEEDVIVEIIFTLDPNAPKDYAVLLDERDRKGTDDMTDGSPVGRPTATDPKISGNYTHIEGLISEIPSGDYKRDGAKNEVDSFTGADGSTDQYYAAYELYGINATAAEPTWPNPIEIHTDLHGDYCAEIRFYTADDVSFAPDSYPSGAQLRTDRLANGTTEYVLVLQKGGDYRFAMRASDVVVRVDYKLATQYTADLVIRHLDESGELANITRELERAQLSFAGYRDDNLGEMRYGKVWRDGGVDIATDTSVNPAVTTYTDKPDVLAANQMNILPIPATAAAMSGSLAGDCAPITTLDDILKAAALCSKEGITPADYTPITDKYNAGDLMAIGLRKDAAGNHYTTEADMTAFAASVLELTEFLKTGDGTTPYNAYLGTYTRDVPGPTLGTTTTETVTYAKLSTVSVETYELLQAWVAATAADRAILKNKIASGSSNAVFKWARDYLYSETPFDHDGDEAAAPTPTPTTSPDPTPSETPIPTTPRMRGIAITGGWTKQNDQTMAVREGRQMRVIAAAGSEYTVQKVVVREKDPATGTTARTIQATKDTRYANVYTFDMPAWDADVEVYYVPRIAPDLTLKITPDPIPTGAAVRMSAYTPSVPVSEYATLVTKSSNGDVINRVLSGSVVRIDIDKVPEKYTVSVRVTDADGATVQTRLLGGGVLIKEGSVVTFVMPTTDTTAEVVFEKIDDEEHRAYISVEGMPEGLDITGANAVFLKGGVEAYSVITLPTGSALEGRVTVPVGYYIHSITAVGRSGSYPYEQSGNGWDNGRTESMKVSVLSEMPDEDLYITVKLALGPPPEEPVLPVTLLVKDDMNFGKDDTARPNFKIFDDNHATMSIGTPADPPTRDKVVGYDLGLVASTSGIVDRDTEYVESGTWVYVDVVCHDDYYIKATVVTPRWQNVEVEWISESRFRFATPDSACAVTVEYAQKTGVDDGNNFHLWVSKTETPSPDTDAANSLDALTIGGAAPNPNTIAYGTEYTTGARKTVEATISVADGWYVRSVRLVRNGVTSWLTLGADNKINFIMPTTNAELIVDYRHGNPNDDAGKFDLRLVVDDPDNATPDGAGGYTHDPNSAWATIAHLDGSADTTLGAFGHNESAMSGVATTASGDHVTVEWEMADGYALDALAVTAAGRTIAPRYVYTPAEYQADGTTVKTPAKTTASFDMPPADTTIYVRFVKGAERLYRADIVIYGADGNLANRASFEDTLGGSVNDDVYNRHGLHGGEYMPVYIEAADGYYIESVTVRPSSTGVAVTLSGSFGPQFASFNMPAADVQVDVKFAKAWPDEAKYGVYLSVVDPMANYSNMSHKLAGAIEVRGGERKWIYALADGEIGNVHIHRAANARVKSVTVTDSAGNPVQWWWSGSYSSMINFAMPPMSVEVVVEYELVTDWRDYQHDVTLHTSTKNGANGSSEMMIVVDDPDVGSTTLTHKPGITAVNRNGTIHDVIEGELVMLTVTPDEGSVVAAAYAVSGGRVLDLYSRQPGATPVVTDGGSATFAMPNADADVYVVFDKASNKTTDRYATLYVSGPVINSSSVSGRAELFERWDGTNTTGIITPNNHSGYIVLGIGSRVRVKIKPSDGYSLASFKILDNAGGIVDYTMRAQEDGSLYDADGYMTAEYIQPQSGSRAYVEFEKIDTNRKYTARVVVDDAGSTGNTAGIDQRPNDAWVKLIKDAKPGEQIDINVVCAIGYEFSIIIVPQSRGIQAPLLLPNNRSQQSSFIMPAEDVVVFVKFVTDSRTRYTASLSVSGGSPSVTSTIRSDFNPVSLVSYSGGSAQIVRAAPDEEKVYVNTRRAENLALGYSIEKITVETTAGDPVPYTMDAAGNLSFPMVASNVNVSIKFKSGNPPTYDLTLHVRNDGVANGIASLTEKGANPANTTGSVSGGNNSYNTRSIKVEAGKTVDLSAAAQNTGTYGIFDVYVVYGDSSPYAGQFIPFGRYDTTMSGGASRAAGSVLRSLAADFVMQPYDVDVYVFFADNEFPPTGTVLWLSVIGPAGAGSATLTTDYVDDTGAAPLVINAGDPDGYLPASPRSYASIDLAIAQGYTIESIVITPLGSDADGRLIGGDLYTLTMPEHTIKVRITLKKSDTTDFIATLHVANIDKDGKTLSSPNRAEIGWPIAKTNWTDSVTSTDAGKKDPRDDSVTLANNQIIVPERQTVDLYAYLNSTGYYLLSAYVLRADGRMVALSGDPIDGTAYDPMLANEIPDAQTSFEMPANDVDVYVVYTNLPKPPDGWRTTALVATEATANGVMTNGGHNTASITEARAGSFFYEYVYEDNELVEINALDPDRTVPYKASVYSFGNPTHKAYAVVEGKGVYVAEETLGEGYAFSPPVTMSASGGVAPIASLISSDPYRYNYTTLDYSTAARMHFIEGSVVAGDLRVEIVDRQNPGDLVVKNRVSVSTPSKPTLGLVSSDSAGAWQIMRSVEPGSQMTALVTPFEGYAATAVLINKDGESTDVELVRLPNGGYTAEFMMPSGGATFRVTFVRGYTAELRVINRSTSSVNATLSSPDGRSVGDRQTITGLLGGEGMTIAASGATVQSVVYAGRTTSGHAISPLESSDWQFTMPAEDTVVTVIFGGSDSTEHTAIIRVDDASDEGWQDHCSIDGIHNDTRPNAAGGRNWTTAVLGDNVTGAFSARDGWYASAYAIVRDPDGTLGELVHPVYVVQSGTQGSGLLAGLTMPDANVEIFVRFTKNDPTPSTSYNLSLEIEGAGGSSANTASAVGGVANLSVNGASTSAGPTSVAAGEKVNVGANWTNGYRLISAEVEVTFTAPSAESGWSLTHSLVIPMTTSGSSASGSFNMPFVNEAIRGTTAATGLSAKVKVKLKFGYDATLTLIDGVGGSSTSMTAGGKSVSVGTNGESKTITGLGKNDQTSTTVSSTGAVSVIGRNATDGSTVLSAVGGVYGYTMNGDSEVVVITSNNTPTDRKYVAAVRLIGAGDGDWAYITDTTSAGMPSGEIWTAARSGDRIRLEVVVGSGRSAKVTADRVTLLPQAIGGDETYLFDMPANDVQITVEFFGESTPMINFGVIDRTGIEGSTASMSHAGGTLVSHTSSGSESGIVGSYVGNFGTLNVAATATTNVAVKKIFVEGRNGGVRDITATKSFAQNTFADGATVWVVFDKPQTVEPPPPDYDPYITYIEVDPASDAGWAEAGNSIGQVLNTTDMTADGGAHWREGSQGDNMRGLFSTADGWYARVKAYRTDNGSELLAMQQNYSGGGTASITQPSSDARIVVLFSKDPRIVSEENQLTLAIVGHGMARGNFAEVEFPDGTMVGVDGGDAPSTDRFTTVVSDKVKAGTRIPLDATWARGYTIAKIEISLDSNGSVYSVPWNEYASMAAANFYMPSAKATITVYYSLEFTATLHIQNSGVVGGGAAMYDDAVPGTKVNTHLGRLEGLGGSEDIVTNPQIPIGGRLVGVFYETAKTGSHSTRATTPNARYDFDMPQEDADVYVVYEPEDEPIKSYVARVEKYGETAVAGNEATILNTSRDVFHTSYSTMAKQGDLIEITVELARGYQARVIDVEPGSLYEPGKPGSLSRTAFRTNGTTTTFTMPADSDAVVKIEFIEGYTATLILDDSSRQVNSAHMTDDRLPNVSASSVPDGKTLVVGDSPASVMTTNYEKYVGAGGSAMQVTDPPVNAITKLGVDDTLDGDVVLSAGSKLYRLIETTPTGGTRNYGERRLYKDDAAPLPILGGATVDWGLSALDTDPVEDVLITAVVLDKDDPSLIAKVQLEGDSDINGNGAAIRNTVPSTDAGLPASAWRTGNIWTSAIEENRIEARVDLAPGYTATVIAINDEVYYAELAALMAASAMTRASMTMDEMIAAAREKAKLKLSAGGGVTDATEVTVTSSGELVMTIMPAIVDSSEAVENTKSDITFIVKFLAESGPRPYDPLSAEYPAGLAEGAEPLLEKGWIYGVNHGDYATITVPTLNTGATDATSGKEILQDVYRAGPAGFFNDFRIYVQTAAGFVELDNSTEIRLYEASPRVDTSYMYNSGNYYTGVGEYVADTQDARGMIDDADYAYTGAKFNVELRKPAEGVTPSAAYLAFKEILESDSYDALIGTKLKIRAVGQSGSISEATQLVLPPAYALAGTLVSYAPQHEATFELYEYDTAAADYSTEAMARNTMSQDYGDGLWRQDFRVMSSELAGRDRTAVFADLDLLRGEGTGFTTPNGHETYRLVISKAAALTYTRDGIELRIENGKAALTATDKGILDGDRTWVLARSSQPAAISETALANVVMSSINAATAPTESENAETATEPEAPEPTEPEANIDEQGAPVEESEPSESVEEWISDDPVEPLEEVDAAEDEPTVDDATEPAVDEETVTDDDGAPVEDEPIVENGAPTEDEASVDEPTAPSEFVAEVVTYADEQIARDLVILMTGDLNGDGRTKQVDYNILYAYYSRQYRWTRAEENETGWEDSTRNPNSLAYWCDLNGDLRIDTLDLAIMTDSYNYNRTTKDYGAPTGLVRAWDNSYDTTLESYLSDVAAVDAASVAMFMFDRAVESVSGLVIERPTVEDEPPTVDGEVDAELPTEDETAMPTGDETFVDDADAPTEGAPVDELPCVRPSDEFILPPPAPTDDGEDAAVPNRREDEENGEEK